MSRREFTEEEMKQLEVEQELNDSANIFCEDANKIIDQCILIPTNTYEKGSAKIMNLVRELDILIKEYEQLVRNNDMWLVGFADAGLNKYTMLVKTYKRASNMLKSKATIMETLIHD